MSPTMRWRLARFLFGATLALLAGAPTVMAASSSGGGSGGGTSGFVPFHGFPPFTQHSSFVPFNATTTPNAPFPRGLCCVTAPAPPIVVQIVENPPPVPAQKPAPPPETTIANEAGVTVIRGGVPH